MGIFKDTFKGKLIGVLGSLRRDSSFLPSIWHQKSHHPWGHREFPFFQGGDDPWRNSMWTPWDLLAGKKRKLSGTTVVPMSRQGPRGSTNSPCPGCRSQAALPGPSSSTKPSPAPGGSLPLAMQPRTAIGTACSDGFCRDC